MHKTLPGQRLLFCTPVRPLVALAWGIVMAVRSVLAVCLALPSTFLLARAKYYYASWYPGLGKALVRIGEHTSEPGDGHTDFITPPNFPMTFMRIDANLNEVAVRHPAPRLLAGAPRPAHRDLRAALCLRGRTTHEVGWHHGWLVSSHAEQQL